MKADRVEVEHVEVKTSVEVFVKLPFNNTTKIRKTQHTAKLFPHFFFSRRGILGLSFFNGEVLGREVQYGSAVQLDGLRGGVVHNALYCVMMGKGSEKFRTMQ